MEKEPDGGGGWLWWRYVLYVLGVFFSAFVGAILQHYLEAPLQAVDAAAKAPSPTRAMLNLASPWLTACVSAGIMAAFSISVAREWRKRTAAWRGALISERARNEEDSRQRRDEVLQLREEAANLRKQDRTQSTALLPAQPSALVVQPDIYVPSSVTPESLAAMYEGKTSAQGDALMASFHGMMMPVSGTVRDVEREDHLGVVTVALHSDISNLHVVLWFAEEHEKARAALLSFGNAVRAVGKIQKVTSSLVLLTKCRLRD